MLSVKDLMTKNPVCINSTDTVTRARSIMRKYGYRALPVLKDEKLVGIVSRGDVLRITSSKTNLQVSGIMNPNVISINSDSDIFSAARLMVKSNIRQIIVTNTELGILSSMDVLRGFIRENYSPSIKKIENIMVRKVVSCEHDDEISRIWEKLYSSGFSGLPVLKKSRVVGMITRTDILKHGAIRLSKESGKRKSVLVERVMRTPAITVTSSTSVKDAAKTMVKNRILRLPVVDKGNKLIGIVDVEDILKAYVS